MRKKTVLAFVFAALMTASTERLQASQNATVTVTGSEVPGDAGELTIYFNGFSETVVYGPYSTAASIASAFAGMFSRDYIGAGLCASATGATITFHLKGTATFGPIGVTGSTTSFNVSVSGWLSEPPAPPAAPSSPCSLGKVKPDLSPGIADPQKSPELSSNSGSAKPTESGGDSGCPAPDKTSKVDWPNALERVS